MTTRSLRESWGQTLDSIRVIRALTGLGRIDEASARAAEAVVRFRASRSAIDLLREVHRDSGRPGGAADELARTLKQRPDDTTLLFALVELLREDGRWAEAEGFLLMQAQRSPDDFGVLRRWVQLRLERDDAEGAARLIVESLASRPNVLDQVVCLPVSSPKLTVVGWRKRRRCGADDRPSTTSGFPRG